MTARHPLAGLATLLAASLGAQTARIDETLANGLRLVVVERSEVPLVTLAVYLRGGLLLDGPDTFRHGSLAMGCLWMGHAGLDEDAVRVALGDIGAEAGSYVDVEDTRIHLACLAPYAVRGLELLAGAILQPNLDEAVVEREREQELRLLAQRRKRPEYLAQEHFVRAVVGDHPLAEVHRLRDAGDRLARADRAAVHRAWQRMAQPQLGTLFLVGRVTDELVAAARQRLGAWPVPETPTSITEPSVPSAVAAPRVIEVPLPDLTQVYLQFGMLGPRLDASVAPAVHVLRLAMAGGFTSSLEDELRVDRGLIYDISFSSPTVSFTPPYSLATQTRPDKVAEVLDVSMRLLRDAAAGKLRPAQIEAARNMWLGTRALERQTQLGLADSMHRSLRLFGGLDGSAREAAAVRATTPEDVAGAAALFDPARFVVVMVGAPADLDRIEWSPRK